VTGVHAAALLAGVLAALGAHAQQLACPTWAPWLIAAGLSLYCAPRLRPLATLCAGVLWAWWPLMIYDRACLPPAYDERVLVNAQLDGLPLRRGADEYFTALVRPLHAEVTPAPVLRATLHWADAPPLRAGERWRLLVQLRAPAVAANPGSTGSAAQWLRQRVHASGQVLVSALDARLAPAPRSLDALRERIASAIAARVAERDAAALIIALAIGDTQRVSAEQWRVFNAVGITHLVAISGLHVTLFCQLCAALAGMLWGRCAPLQRRLPRHSCAAAAGLLASLGYALLAGWSVPTQRTLLMLATWHGLRMAARPRPAARTLASGLVGVLLLDPLAPLAAGFWLSFLAVGALLLQGALAAQAVHGWRAMLHTQGQVTAALVPVTIAVFGSVSLAGLAVNLLAIPVFSLLLVPLILAATVVLGAWPALATGLFKLATLLIGLVWPVLRAAAGSPLALLRAAPPSWWYVLAAVAVAVALLPWRPWMRATALLALLPATVPVSTTQPQGGFAATVFDVGRGQAVLVRTAGHALLFDNGESWGSGGAASAARLLPALRYYDVRRLDVLLLPRLDTDRGAGVLALAAALPPRALLAGGGRALPPEFAPCRAGTRWRWDSVDFELLDAGACTLRVSTPGSILVLTGPLPSGGASRERQSAWFNSGAAQLALLSATARAAQGASVAAAMRSWHAAGAVVYVTGIDGALELRCGATGSAHLASWRKP
jgi:competence protein ComEC